MTHENSNNRSSRFRPFSKDYKFPGFYGPNYTQVPDEAFDALMAQLTGAEYKVLMYVIRRTFGFKKASDRISQSQLEHGISKKDGTVLDYGTGLSRRAIQVAVKSLVGKGVLLKLRHSSAKKGHETTEFALNVLSHENPWIQSSQGGRTPRMKNSQGVLQSKSSQGGDKKYLGLGYKVATQQTVRQETVHTGVSSSLKTEAAELAADFHAKCEHTPAKPTQKEIVHAKNLIHTHGSEKAEFIVNFALDSAREKFGRYPETFGAVRQFIDSGLAAYEQKQNLESREIEQERKRQEEYTLDEAHQSLLDSLSPQERIERKLRTYPPSLYPPAKLEQIRKQMYKDGGLLPPA